MPTARRTPSRPPTRRSSRAATSTATSAAASATTCRRKRRKPSRPPSSTWHSTETRRRSPAMWNIHEAYIDGAFVPVHGEEVVDMVDPATEQLIGRARLGNREDAKRAIAAARRAQPMLAGTTKAQRIDMLHRL